jgi:hypothetical protein
LGGDFFGYRHQEFTVAEPSSTYPISINTNIIDKPDESERERVDLGKDFQAIEPTLDEISDHVSRGHAIAPQYRNGHRRTSNFTKSGFLAADIDEGMTLEEAKDHLIVRHHAGLIHTTASHTPERHRFRIVFPLDEPILSAQDWANAQLGLAIAVTSDRSVSDAARMFFGNSKALLFRIYRSMPADVVADLIARGRDARAQNLSPRDGRWPVDSAKRVGPGELVKLATGEFRRMDEVQKGDKVHCPYHQDSHASAFAVQSSQGGIGIHCSACKVTFWPDNERDHYDFDLFEKLFEARRLGERQEEEAIGFERFFPPKPKFVNLCEEYLPPLEYRPGITLVRSRKGSGKTEALVLLLRDIRAGKFPGNIEKKDRPKSVLLIGHRQTLLRDLAARLGMRCYLDDEYPQEGLLTLAVCLDSLPKYGESFPPSSGRPGWSRKGPFDVVILDEVEQVLKHLLGKTIEKGAGLERCFDALMFEIENAKAVFALDADLGLVTTHAMRTMRSRDWQDNCRIIYNEPIVPAQRRTLRIFHERKRLEREVIEAVRRGERCFITSNSRKCVETLERMIVNECGEDVVIRAVHGGNSHEPAVVRFVKNIKSEFLKIQVVIASPSMGTGVDITFEGGACKVDRVFGFFYSLVNTHTDIDQQLARVRNPGAVDVWFGGISFNFTCNVEVVKDDLARAYTVKRAVRGRRPDGMLDYDRDDPLLMICAHVTALERASKNSLVPLFRKLRESNGWVVESVRELETDSPFNEAMMQRREERAEMLRRAPALTDSDFIDLDSRLCKGAVLSPEEMAAHEKYVFQRTVGVPLDAVLVEMNLDGRLIERVQTLAEMAPIWEDDFQDVLIEPTQLARGRLQTMRPAWLLGVIVRVAGLTTSAGFKPNYSVTIASLAEFVRVCRENQTMIEEVLSEAIRGDLESNPVRQLNIFLKRIGLKARQTHSEKTADGGKIRYYSLEGGILRQMMALAAAFCEVQRQKEADEQDGPRRLGDRRPEQGTQEKPPYISTNTGLLSLTDED